MERVQWIFDTLTFVLYVWQEYEADVDESTRQFILDQNKETSELIERNVKKFAINYIQ